MRPWQVFNTTALFPRMLFSDRREVPLLIQTQLEHTGPIITMLRRLRSRRHIWSTARNPHGPYTRNFWRAACTPQRHINRAPWNSKHARALAVEVVVVVHEDLERVAMETCLPHRPCHRSLAREEVCEVQILLGDNVLAQAQQQ